jgi:hypothetical protein
MQYKVIYYTRGFSIANNTKDWYTHLFGVKRRTLHVPSQLCISSETIKTPTKK